MSRQPSELPAFSCCSIGIGRWFWVTWDSESDARAQSPAVACGYEASASRAEGKVRERVGPDAKRLPSKWASGYKRGGGSSGRASSTAEESAAVAPSRPKSRLSRPRGTSARDGGSTRLAFLYSAAEREPADALGHVAVARHRIVKQNPRKFHVDSEPFDQDEWNR